MTGVETVLAALGGLVMGAGLAGFVFRRRERVQRRRLLEIETRIRRNVLPVLERRAAVLAIPASRRGSDADGAITVALTLAEAIKTQEDSVDLPFGDTVDASREELLTPSSSRLPGRMRD